MSADPPPARDWFGNPLEPQRDPVPCPRCGDGFTDAAALRAHLGAAHGVARPGDGRRPAPDPGATRRDLPALGRNARSPLSRRLRTIPLVVVLAANVAVALVALGALAALEPSWWIDVRSEPWSRFVVVPLMWPTVAFLLLRGLD